VTGGHWATAKTTLMHSITH